MDRQLRTYLDTQDNSSHATKVESHSRGPNYDTTPYGRIHSWIRTAKQVALEGMMNQALIMPLYYSSVHANREEKAWSAGTVRTTEEIRTVDPAK